jgi:hypothetical protein
MNSLQSPKAVRQGQRCLRGHSGAGTGGNVAGSAWLPGWGLEAPMAQLCPAWVGGSVRQLGLALLALAS